MEKRWTSGIGWMALAGFAAGGLLALSRFGRLLETRADQAAVVEADLSLLAEDVRALRGDIEGLAQSIAQGLEELHDALSAAADERERGTRADINVLRAELEASAERGRELAAALSGLEARPQVEPLGGSDEPATGAEQAAGGARAAPSASVADQEPGPAEPEPPEQATAPAPRATRSFLSFELPSESLRVDERQRFEIAAGLSRVGFDAKSTLHDFSGVSEDVRGELTVCLARPSDGPSGSVAILARSLDTRNPDRDAEMRALLDVEREPAIEFRIERFSSDAGGIELVGQSLAGTVHGEMTIKGCTRPFQMPVRLALDESRRLVVEGEAPLALSAFGVEAPSKLGVISMQDEVRIWIALRARCAGRVRETADAR
jgi:polyisoprenoid-binding protein YceI